MFGHNALPGQVWIWLLFLLWYGSWIYNYLCNPCLSPLTLWVRTPLMWGVLYTALCDKVCQWLATGRWSSPGTPVSSTNKTDVHDITKILLKVALNTTNPSSQSCVRVCITIKYRIFSTNETDRHDITKILLKVALNTTTVSIICVRVCIIIKYRKREKYVLYEGRSISVDHWYLILRLILP